MLLENGRILFDLRLATATVATEHGHCVLHVWSEERNCIRHVVDIKVRKTGLRLHVLRMGQSKPQTLELQPQQRRLPSQSKRTPPELAYSATLERLLPRYFPDFQLEGLRTAMDLERSFGPSYARGTLVRGNSAWALIIDYQLRRKSVTYRRYSDTRRLMATSLSRTQWRSTSLRRIARNSSSWQVHRNRGQNGLDERTRR